MNPVAINYDFNANLNITVSTIIHPQFQIQTFYIFLIIIYPSLIVNDSLNIDEASHGFFLRDF
ncbi:MAG: hypothetical protein CM15mP23_06770 [Cryomorphaceae bacterium]|nr:MAG: hypothetical protein CM15mP23_06770 [Cryomorphaceae bacterium]